MNQWKRAMHGVNPFMNDDMNTRYFAMHGRQLFIPTLQRDMSGADFGRLSTASAT